MTPYYDEAGITIYHGDCRGVMPTLPKVDLVLTDPPYGDTSLEWDVPVENWLSLVRPLLAPSASLWCFGSMRMFLAEAGAFAAWHLAQDIVWEKHNGSSLHADRFRRVHEHVLQFYPRGVAWGDVYKAPVTTMDATRRAIRGQTPPAHLGGYGTSTYSTEEGGPRLMRSVIYARSSHGSAIHPTQKPLKVVMPLIEYSCPPGGLILDPFAGSLTTAVAAKRLGRRCIAIEREWIYVEQGVERLLQGMLDLEGAP